MPALISHRLLGEKVLPEIERLAGFKINRDCFFWGCQGPDVLFYSIPRPQTLFPYARKLHKSHPEEFFASLRDFIKENESGKGFLLSYALGICCHYAFDRTAHPYVLWLVDELEKTDRRPLRYDRHDTIETNLDIMLLRREKGVTPRDFAPGCCLRRSESAMAAVSLTMRYLIRGLYGREVSMRQSMSLCDDMLLAVCLLDDPYGFKRPAALATEKLFGSRLSFIPAHVYTLTADTSVDYANLSGRLWHNIYAPEEESRESYFDLFGRAAVYTASMCQYFIYSLQNDELDFADITEGRNFSYGAAVYE